MIKYISIFCIALCVGCSTMKKADKSFYNGEYSTAIYMYQKAVKPDDPESNFQLAEAYRQSNRISEAEPYYKASLDAGIDDESAHYYYAVSLKTNERFEEAIKVLENYLNKGEDPVVVAKARRELDNITQISELKDKPTYYRVKNLETLNTPNAEYSPIYNKGYLYFTSNRQGGKVYKGTGTPFTDIYKVKTKGAKININTLQPITDIINDPDINEGSITISADGTSIIFAKGNNGKSSGTNEVNLYFVRHRNGRWTKPRPLNINGMDTWDSSPALSPDGSTLYFSSNREGGFGGLDLYSAKLNRRGRWVDVRNLGDKINTPGNEVFPYVASDGKLYFSSDGHSGLGGLDLFSATRESGHITVENLGQPMNSPKDDFGIFLFNPTRGFFTSNRKGGKGDDDIYTFVNDDPNLKIVNYFLSGATVTPNKEGELVPLPNTKVLLVGEDNEIIDEVFTKVDGRYTFRVYSEENYDLIAEKEDYFTTRKSFSTLGKSVDRSKLEKLVTNVNFNMDLPLNAVIPLKPIVLENIFYDLDRWEIRPDAALELDKLVVLLNDNPNIEIELSSHTDARADHNYNMRLSENRAKSAVEYLISKGIDKNRLQAKGYGETRLIIENAETESEHQQNRRTEFKVTRYNKHIDEEDLEDFDETDRFFEDDDDNGGKDE